MSNHGALDAIWIKPVKLGAMDPVDTAILVADAGIVGNSNQNGKRQVTIIEREVFDEIRRSLPDAEPYMRRANFMVSGIRLDNTRHHILTVGDVRIQLWGETRPCERMDAQCPGLTAALDPHWRGGAYGVVMNDGEVRVGDTVTLTPPA